MDDEFIKQGLHFLPVKSQIKLFFHVLFKTRKYYKFVDFVEKKGCSFCAAYRKAFEEN